MDMPIQIVDRGRGPQLATSRITVLDLVHYFQRGASYDEIIRWIPTLSHEQIAVVERYYREHQAVFDEKDRRDEQGLVEKVMGAAASDGLGAVSSPSSPGGSSTT